MSISQMHQMIEAERDAFCVFLLRPCYFLININVTGCLLSRIHIARAQGNAFSQFNAGSQSRDHSSSPEVHEMAMVVDLDLPEMAVVIFTLIRCLNIASMNTLKLISLGRAPTVGNVHHRRTYMDKRMQCNLGRARGATHPG